MVLLGLERLLIPLPSMAEELTGRSYRWIRGQMSMMYVKDNVTQYLWSQTTRINSISPKLEPLKIFPCTIVVVTCLEYDIRSRSCFGCNCRTRRRLPRHLEAISPVCLNRGSERLPGAALAVVGRTTRNISKYIGGIPPSADSHQPESWAWIHAGRTFAEGRSG